MTSSLRDLTSTARQMDDKSGQVLLEIMNRVEDELGGEARYWFYRGLVELELGLLTDGRSSLARALELQPEIINRMDRHGDELTRIRQAVELQGQDFKMQLNMFTAEVDRKEVRHVENVRLSADQIAATDDVVAKLDPAGLRIRRAS